MTALGGAVPTFWSRASHELTEHFYQAPLSYQTTAMLLSEHAGTHLDAPYHFDEAGLAVEQLPSSRLFARARVLDLTSKQPLEGIGPRDLEEAARRGGIEIAAGDAGGGLDGALAELRAAGLHLHWPFITAAGADWLAERRPALVVTDLVGLDEPVDHATPVHDRLLRAGICQLQVLTNVGRLAEGESWVAAFPLKLVRGTGSPVRAWGALA